MKIEQTNNGLSLSLDCCIVVMAVGRWIFYPAILMISLDIFCSNKDYLTLECGRKDPLNCQTVSLWSFHGTKLSPYGFAWLHLQPSRRPRGKRYLSARASLYPNHDASFSLTRVARSGVDCKTVRIFAYSSTREQSNERSGTKLKTESETGEKR